MTPKILALLFLLLPTYLIRFHVGPLPSTLLEVLIGAVFFRWLWKERYDLTKKLQGLVKTYRALFIFSTIFLIAATISVFTSLDLRAAAGQWKAFYIEPLLIFLVLVTSVQKKQGAESILSALLLGGLATSLLAIYQHFTGWMVPYAFWENRNTYRVTAWYGFPNGVGLFLAPLVPLALYKVKAQWQNRRSFSFWIALALIPCALLAIWYARSTGGLIGVAGGIGFLLLIHKKTRRPAIAIGALSLVGLFLLPASNPIREELLLQDRSGQIRLHIWSETLNLLKERPLTGAGLASYSQRIEPYHTTVNGEGIEIFHHPHNIFLTMWVNLGLLGLIGFAGILISFYRIGFRNVKNETVLFLLATMTALLVTGLVDSPYIKNDLSLLFWLLLALLLSTIDTGKQPSYTTCS